MQGDKKLSRFLSLRIEESLLQMNSYHRFRQAHCSYRDLRPKKKRTTRRRGRDEIETEVGLKIFFYTLIDHHRRQLEKKPGTENLRRKYEQAMKLILDKNITGPDGLLTDEQFARFKDCAEQSNADP